MAVSAQRKDSFKVLLCKGNTSVGGKPLYVGQELKRKDIIIVADSGYVGLIHYVGKPLEIKKPGKYAVKDLDQLIKRSIQHKYDELLNPKN